MSTPEETVTISPEAAARIVELQRIITESQRKADKSEDEDVKEALNLQISALGLKVSRLRQGKPEEAPVREKEVPEEDLEPIPETTEAQLQEADMLIQRAMLEKRRGNKQAASDLLKKAAEVAPNASVVIEALGDDYMERRQYAAAQETYKKAKRADPKNASAERKLAELARQGLAGLSVEDQLRMGSSDSVFIQQGESMANPKFAVVLSGFIPGVGQLVLGFVKKGLTYLSVFLGSLVIVGVISIVTRETKHWPAFGYIPIGIAVLTWIASVADASSYVKKEGPRLPPSASKPVPPVNLPFE